MPTDVKELVDQWIRSRGTSMDGASYGAAIELAAYIASNLSAPVNTLTDEQRIAIKAAIEISEDIKAEVHDGSFLSDVSIASLRALLAASDQGD